MIAQASPAAGPLRADPSKRVNYTLGLVLGVDEFQQDQLYHAAARRGHNRLLHGYGTVWGLRVNPVSGGSDPEIQVEPGVAVDPCGREICVPDLMCVKLTSWLDRQRPVLETLFPDPTLQPIPLAVILCHRECATDTVPVPGEPCRTQEDAMQPSRIRESFELKLALRDDAPWASPPAGPATGLTVFRVSQPEEQAVRAFGLLLARVQTTTDPALAGTGEAELLAGVRALESAASETTLASPPAETDDPILLPADRAPEILRDAFRVWVTEVRPRIRRMESPDLCADPDAECCVLLSEIDLEVTADWAVAAGPIESREERRPYLLHTRLLQEWLIAGGGEEGRPDIDSWATLEILGPNHIRVWVHHDGWLDLPREALTVLRNDHPLPEGAVLGVPFAGIRNVWDVVIDSQLIDGDVVEIRFDTKRVPLIEPPPSYFRPDEGPFVADSLVVGGGGAIAPGQPAPGFPVMETTSIVGPPTMERPSPTRPREEWTPSTATRRGVTVADELRGPTGEYLDRYGWTLSAFTIYDRIEGGDLTGEYKVPTVAKIQRFPVDPANPREDQYLVSDGAKWLPRHLPDGTRDLSGRYPGCTVVGVRGRPVSGADPVADQYLMWDGSQWVPAHLPNGRKDLAGRYPESTVVGIQGTPVSSTKPGQEQYLKYDGTNEQWAPANLPRATGDLVGTYPELRVAGLRGREVAATEPGAGQVLGFVDGKWVPMDVGPLIGTAEGDVTGPYTDLRVEGLRNRPIAAATPEDGQFLAFRQASEEPGEWTPTSIEFSPASDLGGTFPNVQIAKLQGRPVSAGAPADGQVLQYRESSPPGDGIWVPAGVAAGGATGTAGGDLAGTYPDPQIARLQGRTLAAAAPTDGQILRYTESSPPGNGRWVSVPLPGATGTAGGDLAGTYPAPQIARLQGKTLAAAAPMDGQVLQYRESSPPGNGRWVSVPLPGATGTAGGDLTGTYPNPQITRLQGNAVAAARPAINQYLMFDGQAWVPSSPPGGAATAYEVIAAGSFDVIATDARPTAPTFNSLVLRPMGDWNFALTDFPYDPRAFVYIVKGTSAAGAVLLGRKDEILTIRIVPLGEPLGTELHVEVSRYPI